MGRLLKLKLLTELSQGISGYMKREGKLVQTVLLQYLRGHVGLNTGIKDCSLPDRATVDKNDRLLDFAHKPEAACVETVESGNMTKDLAILAHGPKVSRDLYLTTEEFIEAVAQTLESKILSSSQV